MPGAGKLPSEWEQLWRRGAAAHDEFMREFDAAGGAVTDAAANGPGCSGFTRRAGDAASASAATTSSDKLSRAQGILRQQKQSA